jgi:hypothetical protein
VVKAILLTLVLGLAALPPAWGQTSQPPPVQTNPKPVWGCSVPGSPSWNSAKPTSCPGNASGTIASTGVFQDIWTLAPNGGRTGCTVQNNGTGTMWVFVGPQALATEGASWQLGPPANGQPGGVFYCSLQNGGVLQDEIAITGTSGDAFTADQQ